MKKIIYTLLFIAFSYQIGFSQCTSPSYNGNHGWILPDSSQFPHATIHQAFATNIQIQVAHDTVGTFPVPIIGSTHGDFVFDSITVHGVTTQPALPNGVTIQYTCNPVGCSFPGASTGCINVNVAANGVPHKATYRIIVTAVGKGVFTPTASQTTHIPQTITQIVNWYKIVVDSTGGASLVENVAGDFNFNEFSFLNLKPNPATDEASVEFYSPKSITVKMNLLDVVGRKIYAENIAATNGINKTELNIAALQNGIYLINFQYDDRIFSKKLIINN
jgi:hypothetical protein